MAFSMPRVVPTFDDPNRHHENQRWASSGMGSANGAPEKTFTNGWLGGSQDLPMYKDKPYAQSHRRKRYSKRLWAGIALTILTILWLFGGSFSATDRVPSAFPGRPWKWWSSDEAADWPQRQQKVKEAFLRSWTAYERYGWGMDEYHPISRTGRQMNNKGLGWIIVDSLDTLMIMGLTKETRRAREWIQTSLDWDQPGEVNTFETTIRMLGGLLSAHYLSTELPHLTAPASDEDAIPEHAEDLYLEKAVDLADRLLQGFNTGSGIPASGVDLHSGKPIPSKYDGGAASTSEATSVQLELKYVAKLTGEQHYWDRAEHVTKVVDRNNMTDGLLPIYIYPDTGNFRGNEIRLGSRGDSYYEYLIKQYLQTELEEPIYLDMWQQALAGIKKHLVTYSVPNHLTLIAERPAGLTGELRPKMDHLVCFMPGTIAMGATRGLTLAEARISSFWSAELEEDVRLARELMQTCYGMYAVTATGLAPEIAWFRTATPDVPYSKQSDAGAADGDGDKEGGARLLKEGEKVPLEKWGQDFDIRSNDVHNLQRPETVESLFLMYRVTGEDVYREWGWRIFEAFMQHSAVVGTPPTPNSKLQKEKKLGGVEDGPELAHGGFTSLSDVTKVPAPQRDNMESFWLAETLKYFYLLFGDRALLPLDKVVFNTEAHPLPRFGMGGRFKTGWEREGGMRVLGKDAGKGKGEEKGGRMKKGGWGKRRAMEG